MMHCSSEDIRQRSYHSYYPERLVESLEGHDRSRGEKNPKMKCGMSARLEKRSYEQEIRTERNEGRKIIWESSRMGWRVGSRLLLGQV